MLAVLMCSVMTNPDMRVFLWRRALVMRGNARMEEFRRQNRLLDEIRRDIDASDRWHAEMRRQGLLPPAPPKPDKK